MSGDKNNKYNAPYFPWRPPYGPGPVRPPHHGGHHHRPGSPSYPPYRPGIYPPPPPPPYPPYPPYPPCRRCRGNARPFRDEAVGDFYANDYLYEMSDMENVYQNWYPLDTLLWDEARGMSEQMQEQMSRDHEYLKGLYPVQMQRLQLKIEEIVDQLDYEGSPIYDEYPDRMRLYRIIDEIYMQVMEEMHKERMEQMADMDTDSNQNMDMNMPEDRMSGDRMSDNRMFEDRMSEDEMTNRMSMWPDEECLRDAVQILLCQEIFYRRLKKL